MSVTWYAKLEANFHANRKARMAGRLGREVFIFVLCQNAARGALGWIPASDLEPWYLADQLQMSEDEAVRGIDRAIAAQLIRVESDVVQICGWDAEYAKRPLTGGERQQRRRDKLKAETETDSDHDSHASSVTRHEDNVTNHGERDASRRKEGRKEGRETARDARGSRSGFDSDPIGPRTRKRPEAGQSLDSAWQPSAALTAIARSLGLDPAHEARQFRLNAAARGHLFVDPDAAFEKFMRGSRDIGKAPRPKPKPGSRTSTPRPMRFQAEDGTWLEEGPDGELRPVIAQSSAASARTSEQAATSKP